MPEPFWLLAKSHHNSSRRERCTSYIIKKSICRLCKFHFLRTKVCTCRLEYANHLNSNRIKAKLLFKNQKTFKVTTNKTFQGPFKKGCYVNRAPLRTARHFQRLKSSVALIFSAWLEQQLQLGKHKQTNPPACIEHACQCC